MHSILVTGGAGYIGSHTVYELLSKNFDVVVLDNFSNSNIEALNRISNHLDCSLNIIDGDLCNFDIVNEIFSDYKITNVIHFAGSKSVSESIYNPMLYYQNNVNATINLLKAMSINRVKNIVFSSSATVYGHPIKLPLLETMPLGEPTNPYGRSKIIIESILSDLYSSDNDWNIAILRYFNPVGAHSSGMIGEDPQGIPSNLMSYIAQTAIGNLPYVEIFGNDYDTPDGTGIRDYIHVVDLAKGHLAALNACNNKIGLQSINLGTGRGVSVLDLVTTFSKINNIDVPYKIVNRRPGDVPICIAGVNKAHKILGWRANLGIDDMCKDAWKWQSLNPYGYKKI